ERLGDGDRGAQEPRPEARHLLRRAPGRGRRRGAHRRPHRGDHQGPEHPCALPARTAGPAHRHEVHAGPALPPRRELRRGGPDGPAVRRPQGAGRPDGAGRGRGLMARRRKGDPVHGWVCLDKPLGLGSTEAVSKVRRLFNAAKAGHAGTLDPLATGVLPIALGEATKTVPFMMEARKAYRFTVRWGESTATLDREGEIIARSDVRPSPEAAAAALAGFVGEIEQIPPAFSAIRVDGERAYDLARDGVEVVLEPRRVTIHEAAV